MKTLVKITERRGKCKITLHGDNRKLTALLGAGIYTVAKRMRQPPLLLIASLAKAFIDEAIDVEAK